MTAENPENDIFDPDFDTPASDNPDDQETPTNTQFIWDGSSYFTGLFMYTWTEFDGDTPVYDWVSSAVPSGE